MQGPTLPTDTTHRSMQSYWQKKQVPLPADCLKIQNTTHSMFHCAIRSKSSQGTMSLMKAGFANEPKERSGKLEE